MTTLPPKQVEQSLIIELGRAEVSYRRALATLEAAIPSTATATSEEITACLERLQPIMARTQETEANLVPLRQHWISLKLRPGPELQRILKQHEQLLGTLISRINDLEEKLQQHRRDAIPGVDTFVRHHQMQKAYQQISR